MNKFPCLLDETCEGVEIKSNNQISQLENNAYRKTTNQIEPEDLPQSLR